MRGIEQCLLVLGIIVKAVNIIKETGKPRNAIISQITSLFKIKFKVLAAEIKDLTQEEIAQLVDFLVLEGFKQSVAEKTVKGLIGQNTSTVKNLVGNLLKKF